MTENQPHKFNRTKCGFMTFGAFFFAIKASILQQYFKASSYGAELEKSNRLTMNWMRHRRSVLPHFVLRYRKMKAEIAKKSMGSAREDLQVPTSKM